jgi:transketolase
MEKLISLATYIRALCIEATTHAGSGHLTSSLSATDLMVGLMFGGTFRFNVDSPDNPNNDRLIFSKGHASPLLYALWACAGGIPVEELLTLRQFDSRLEGHPSRSFPYADVVTGSLGQGLSMGLGMALNARIDKLPYRTYVLLGDSEMTEGSNWEAIQLASHYTLNNIVGIIDVNRLGQRGETLYSHKINEYVKRIEAHGWHSVEVDGHNMQEIVDVFNAVEAETDQQNRPTMIVAKTLKGKGVASIEDKDGWHGKALSQEEASKALQSLGYGSDRPPSGNPMHADVASPDNVKPAVYKPSPIPAARLEESDEYTKPLSPRKAYGHALVKIHPDHPNMVVLDAEMSNSTFSEIFQQAYPERFYEMFIAEQNMVSMAVGLAARGKLPFVSTFGAFFTRAFDQLRIAAYSQVQMICVGSHVGVSIGEDGVTQMGLEDIALFSALLGSVVVSPADHIATEKLLEALTQHKGLSYMRVTRADKNPIYGSEEEFVLGGSKTLKATDRDAITVVATGITLLEALNAHTELMEKHAISIRVIDAYSIKPIDVRTLQQAAVETKALITVEDHYLEGGLGDTVRRALSDRPVRVYSLAVAKRPKSGTPEKLLAYEEINAQSIIKKVLAVVSNM